MALDSYNCGIACIVISSSGSAHFIIRDSFIPQASCIMLEIPGKEQVLQFLNSKIYEASDHKRHHNAVKSWGRGPTACLNW